MADKKTRDREAELRDIERGAALDEDRRYADAQCCRDCKTAQRRTGRPSSPEKRP